MQTPDRNNKMIKRDDNDNDGNDDGTTQQMPHTKTDNFD